MFDHSLLSRAGQLATFDRASDFLATYVPLTGDRSAGERAAS